MFRNFAKFIIFTGIFMYGLSGCGGGQAIAEVPASVKALSTVNDPTYASWTAAMSDTSAVLPSIFPAVTNPVLNDQTLRHVLHLSLSGEFLRIKLSNLYGKSPLTFNGVHIAKHLGQSRIDADSDREVTFGGKPDVTLAAGTETMSDTVALSVNSLTDITITMYFATPSLLPTAHLASQQTTYIGAGKQLSAASLPAAGIGFWNYYGVTAVESARNDKPRVLVALGDSITEGVQAGIDTNQRFTSQLDNRLKASGENLMSIVNQGISGNRWLNDGSGPSGNSRLERDVLNVKGASHLIILLGINDIGFGAMLPAQDVSADQIVASISSAVDKARAKGIKVFVGTLMPFKGSGYYSDAGEIKRQAVNAWIRANTSTYTVIDFDVAMRQSGNPAALNAAYDSGDHLHPNSNGYGAMANAVDISQLK